MTELRLTDSGGMVSFKYDPFGRRIRKSSSSGASIYAYDGDNLVEETNAAGAVVARYSGAHSHAPVDPHSKASNISVENPPVVVVGGYD